MNVYVVLGICFIPLVLVFVLVKIFSKIPVLPAIIAVLLGLAAVIPISFVQFLIEDIMPSSSFFQKNGILSLLVRVILLAGVLEEGLKFVVEFAIPKKKLSLSQFLGALMIFGITLGCFESLIYYLTRLQKVQAQGGEIINTIFIRMFTSDLIHFACASISGMAVFALKSKIRYFSPVIFAILIHGLFDMFSSFENEIKWFAVAVVLLALLKIRLTFQRVQEKLINQGCE